MTDLVGFSDIAERLGVAPRTPYQWRRRGLLPPPTIDRRSPLWKWTTIREWAETNGRLPPKR